MKCFKMHFINIKSKYADIFREIYLIYVYFRYTEHIFASNRVYIEDIHISERVRHALVQIINSQAERITYAQFLENIRNMCTSMCAPCYMGMFLFRSVCNTQWAHLEVRWGNTCRLPN